MPATLENAPEISPASADETARGEAISTLLAIAVAMALLLAGILGLWWSTVDAGCVGTATACQANVTPFGAGRG